MFTNEEAYRTSQCPSASLYTLGLYTLGVVISANMFASSAVMLWAQLDARAA